MKFFFLANLSRVLEERFLETRPIKVLLMVFPCLTNGLDGVCPFASRHQELKAIAQENGFSYLDLLSSFKQVGFDKLRSEDIVHPNALGHEVAAKTLLESIRKLRV